MAITIFAVYFLVLLLVVWAEVIHTSAGVLALLVGAGIGISVIIGAGWLTRK